MKSLLIGSAAALVTFALFYGFFAIHKELEVRPAAAYWLGLLAFVLGTVVTMIYFHKRAER